MLFHLLFMPLVCSGLSIENYGKDFITAFPENIAYYYPEESSNKLQITAFSDDTLVIITINHTKVYSDTLQSGQTKTVQFPNYIEQYQFTITPLLVKVSSTENIAVFWLSKRGDSVQSNIVQPLKNLRKWYSIPFINYNLMMASLYNMSDQLAPDNWRYNSFRLIVINAEDTVNNITVQSSSPDGQTTFKIKLRAYELYQFQTNGSDIILSSDAFMSVLLTHPCVETTGCGCNMVVSHVLPQNLWGDKYVVPSVKNLNETWLQVTNTTEVKLDHRNIKTKKYNSSELIPFPDLKQASQFINASNDVSIRLISPGFVLELIPETMFAGCYLIQITSKDGEAVIIAETTSKNDVHIDSNLISSTDWTRIPNSIYSSISVPLNEVHVVWHPTSRIGVYRFENMKSGIPYGSPAIILNEDPDQNGCGAGSAQFMTSTDVMTWPESHHYCLNISYQLATPSSEAAQKELASFLQNNGSVGYYWIGLRRSLFTSEWYWEKGNGSVSYTKWADGHPDKPWKALCAAVSQDANKDYSWKSVSCCTKLRPICYKEGKYFDDKFFDKRDHLFKITY